MLVVQIKTYKKEEITTFVVDTNDEYLLLWRQASGEVVKYEHLKLQEAFTGKVEKVEVVQRVGFIAIMILKKKEEKGKYWLKECIDQIYHEGES